MTVYVTMCGVVCAHVVGDSVCDHVWCGMVCDHVMGDSVCDHVWCGVCPCGG